MGNENSTATAASARNATGGATRGARGTRARIAGSSSTIVARNDDDLRELIRRVENGEIDPVSLSDHLSLEQVNRMGEIQMERKVAQGNEMEILGDPMELLVIIQAKAIAFEEKF